MTGPASALNTECTCTAFAQNSPETKQSVDFLGNGSITILTQTIEDLNLEGNLLHKMNQAVNGVLLQVYVSHPTLLHVHIMFRAALNQTQFCLIALNSSLSWQVPSVPFNLCYTAVMLCCHGDTLPTVAVTDNCSYLPECRVTESGILGCISGTGLFQTLSAKSVAIPLPNELSRPMLTLALLL